MLSAARIRLVVDIIRKTVDLRCHRRAISRCPELARCNEDFSSEVKESL